MSTTPPATTDPLSPTGDRLVPALRPVETAPSTVLAEGPALARLLGFIGLFAFVLGAVVVVNQLEGNFLQPVVMGRSLRLHALVILIALTIGTVLGGIVGAVLSVPIAAVAWGIVQVWDGDDRPARMFRQKRPEVA